MLEERLKETIGRVVPKKNPVQAIESRTGRKDQLRKENWTCVDNFGEEEAQQEDDKIFNDDEQDQVLKKYY